MPTCNKCGKSVAFWAKDLKSGLCPECARAALKEEMQNSFPCVIPDVPLSTLERIGVGITTGGLGRSGFRDARMRVNATHMQLSARDEYGSECQVFNVPFEGGSKATLTRFNFGSQMKAAGARTVIVGLGIGLAMAIVVASKAGMENLPLCLLLGAVCGVLLGGLFNFLPALFKADPNIRVVEIRVKKGQSVAFLLRENQMNEAKRVLSRAGITLSADGASENNGQRPINQKDLAQLRETFSSRSTQDLKAIYAKRNPEEYRPEALEAVRCILVERGELKEERTTRPA